MGFKRKFEIGDKVIVKSTKEVGEVVEYFEREYRVKLNAWESNWYRAEKLEKYEEEPLMPETDDSDPYEWKVGDKVVIVRDFVQAKVGLTGTVIVANDSAPGVQFDMRMGGHACDGKGKSGYCWWITRSDVGNVKRIVKNDKCAKIPTLETGMRVKLRDGRIGLIVENARVSTAGVQKFAILLQGGGFCYADEYVDGKTKSGNKDFDIVEVWAFTVKGEHVVCSMTLDMTLNGGYELIWERVDAKKLTKKQAEKELSEKHGLKVVIEG